MLLVVSLYYEGYVHACDHVSYIQKAQLESTIAEVKQKCRDEQEEVCVCVSVCVYQPLHPAPVWSTLYVYKYCCCVCCVCGAVQIVLLCVWYREYCCMFVVCVVQIERLKGQLSQQESSKRAQGEELEALRVQLERLKKEEREYKQRVSRGERGRGEGGALY